MLGTFIRERNQKLFPIISRIYFLFYFNDILIYREQQQKCVGNWMADYKNNEISLLPAKNQEAKWASESRLKEQKLAMILLFF